MRIFLVISMAVSLFLTGCVQPGSRQYVERPHFGSVYKEGHFYVEFLPVCFGPALETVLGGNTLNVQWPYVVQAVNDGVIPTPSVSKEFRVTLRGVRDETQTLTIVDRYEHPLGSVQLQSARPGEVQAVVPLRRFAFETPRNFWSGSQPTMMLEPLGYDFFYRGQWVRKIQSTDDTPDFLHGMITTQKAYMTIFVVRC